MKVTGADDAAAEGAFDGYGEVDGVPAVVVLVVPVVPVVVVAVVPVVPLAVVVLVVVPAAALAFESIRALVSVKPPSAPLLRQPVTVTSRGALSLLYL
jgi:hypothetical protein